MNQCKGLAKSTKEQQQKIVRISQLLEQGKKAQANTQLKRLLSINPELAEAHLLMSKLKVEQKKIAPALQHSLTAYELSPSVDTRVQYATLLFATSKLELAETILLGTESEAPREIRSLRILRLIYASRDTLLSEFTTLLKLKELTQLTELEEQRIYLLLKRIETWNFNPDILAYLSDLLDTENIEHIHMSKPVCEYLIQKYRLNTPDPQISMDEIQQDTLLIKALPKVILVSPTIEEFLTAIRKSILQTALQQQELSNNSITLARSICLQNYLNEYIHGCYQDEQQMLQLSEELLALQINQPSWQPSTSQALLLIIAMYRQLAELPFRQQLLNHPPTHWPESLKTIATKTLFDPDSEEKEMRQIKALTEINDLVSKNVQQHYEQNPYPRWLTTHANQVGSINTLISTFIPGFNGSQPLKEPTTPILIAGCGTGQQAIRSAQAFPKSSITAIDISRQSLAYAKNKARELKINTIDFFQADILELPSTGLKFHYIECAGVLHHMQNPFLGWKALVDSLEPGGVMLVSLYSKRARRNVTVERNKITALKLQPTRENIINYRQVMLQEEEPSPIVNQFRDFYCLSECRDLIFHQHEKCFSWIEIGQHCEALGLEFLGLYNEQTLIKECQKAFGTTLQLDNTEHLDILEREYPDLFSGMYSFFCHKPKN